MRVFWQKKTGLYLPRHTGDYDDFMEWTQEDLEPYIAKVESFIGKIEKLFPETTDTTLDSAEV